MRITKKFCITAAALLGLWAAVPARSDVIVSFYPQDAAITDVGQTAVIELRATFTAPIVAWGLDLSSADPTVAAWTSVDLAPAWDVVASLDGDGLAGLRFPTGLSGEVLLATLTFTGLTPGVTTLTSSYNGEDEGFLNELGFLDSQVTFLPGTLTVLPEPASLVLLAAFVAVARRRS